MSNLSKAFLQRLGFPEEPKPVVVMQALGLHQSPLAVVQFLKRYPDHLPFPKQLRWVYQPVVSRYSRPFLELSVEQQAEIKTLAQHLSPDQPLGWLEKLKDLQVQHPDVPALFNLETSWYRVQGNSEQWLENALKVWETFPEYIFAACSLASYYLSQNHLDKVPKVFNYRLDLVDFDGERDFESAEVAAFYSVLCWYHLLSMHLPRAAYYYALVVNVDPLYPFIETLAALFLRLPEQVLLDLKQALSKA